MWSEFHVFVSKPYFVSKPISNGGRCIKTVKTLPAFSWRFKLPCFMRPASLPEYFQWRSFTIRWCGSQDGMRKYMLNSEPIGNAKCRQVLQAGGCSLVLALWLWFSLARISGTNMCSCNTTQLCNNNCKYSVFWLLILFNLTFSYWIAFNR